MQNINEILYEGQKVITIVSASLSLINTIWGGKSFIEVIDKNKKEEIKIDRTKLIKKIVINIIMVLMFVGVAWYTNSLVEVPNVIGKTYGDAKIILIKNDLNFNTNYGNNGYTVIEQGIEHGRIVKKNTMITLKINPDEDVITPKFDKKEIIESLHKNEYKFFRLNLACYEWVLSVTDINGKTLREYGKKIDDSKLKKVELTNKEYGIKFSDYSIIENYDEIFNANVVFNEDIPVGEYQIVIEAEGYDKVNKIFDFKQEEVDINAEEHLSVSLMPSNSTKPYNYKVSLVDENFEAFRCQNCYLEIEEKNGMMYGIELDEKSGFYLKSKLGTKFILRFWDNYGVEYNCSIVYESVENEIYVVVNSDGTVRQADYVDYLNSIS